MGGRRPKPALLKVLMGTPQRDRVNYAEPVPATNLAAPPEWFTVKQRAEWQRQQAAAPAGLWKELDRPLLAAFVCATVTYREAAELLDKQRGLLGKKAARYLAIRDAQARVLKALASELGTSPAARPRLQVAPEPGERASRFERLLG